MAKDARGEDAEHLGDDGDRRLERHPGIVLNGLAGGWAAGGPARREEQVR
ncbi:hypothetical protein ACOBQX_08075 [Actinokineospora sp. G85]